MQDAGRLYGGVVKWGLVEKVRFVNMGNGENTMNLLQYPQEQCGSDLVQKIIALENTAWPSSGEKETFPSDPNTYVTSFVLLENDAAVCHVGIRKGNLSHKGKEYLAYGLSEVVTHPAYQNQGLASQLIKRAAKFIIAQRPDISIFTCDKSKVSFYTKGGWEAVAGSCFVGGTKENPFRSDSLNLVTMMMFLSSKGKRHKKDFENADIVFELGEGQLW